MTNDKWWMSLCSTIFIRSYLKNDNKTAFHHSSFDNRKSSFVIYSAIKIAFEYPSSINISSCLTASSRVVNFPTRTR